MPDREMVIKALEHCKDNQHVNDCNKCDYGGKSGVFCIRMIDDAITLLKEQEALVRCKDCKYYTGGIDGYCDRWFRRSGGNMAFCSEGEREKQTAE